MSSIVNEEAERGVLGSCLVGSLSGLKTLPIDVAMDKGCDATWFYTPSSSHLWSVLEDMHTSGKKIDLITLGKELVSAGRLDSVGGYEGLESLIDDTPTATHIEYYLDIIENDSKRRKVRNVALDASDAMSRDDVDVAMIIASASEALTALSCNREPVSVDQMMDDNLTVLENAYNGHVSGIPLPWTRFSNHISGLQRACVCPWVGRDGKGKSGAIAQCLDFWAGENIPTLSFSMEDVARRTLLRMAGCRQWFSARSVESGRVLMNGRWEQMNQAEKGKLEGQLIAYKEWLRDKPFWIDDNKYTVEQVCAKIRHYHRVHGVQVVTIDGFKDIVHSKGKSDTECEKHIAQELQRVAKECNIAMPVVSHINKIDDSMAISKEHITGSGTQFKGARQVLIFQDAGLPSIIEDGIDFVMSCTKNNFGSGGSARLRRDENVLAYEEVVTQKA